MKEASPGTGLSRRQWAAAWTGVLLPLAAPARQSPPPSSAPAELEARRDSLRLYQNAIRRARLPRETEPAFRFQP
ncbi:MAG: hypothetical protein ABSE21_12800 [Bryobacteraceae bacterium]|jgi:hypothetical protein